MIAVPGLAPAILALVVAQRLGELWLSARNTRRLRAAGAVEHGAGHYPLFILLHGGWLAALAVSVSWHTPVNPWLIGAFVALQAGRVWVIATLGGMWTTRVISLPDAPLVRRGPYRWLKHPNYLVVALEIPVLPLAFGLPWLAAGFAAANLALLAHRIRLEDRALADRPASPSPGSG